MGGIKNIDELIVYREAMQLADTIWDLVPALGHFERYGIGQQITSAADSIAANISEGFGRYYYKENRRFCYYARGSLAEAKTRLVKMRHRGIIETDTSVTLLSQCDTIGKMLNGYIASIGRALK